MLEASNLGALDRVRHGFFTRAGGVSEGVFALAQLRLLERRRGGARRARTARVALARLGVPAEQPLHRAPGARRRGRGRARARPGRTEPVEADALVTDRPGVTLGVLQRRLRAGPARRSRRPA